MKYSSTINKVIDINDKVIVVISVVITEKPLITNICGQIFKIFVKFFLDRYNFCI